MDTNKIINRLKAKARGEKGVRIPNLSTIAKLLKEKEITDFEYSITGTMKLKGKSWQPTWWDTYSANTWQYAQQVLEVIGEDWKITKEEGEQKWKQKKQ